MVQSRGCSSILMILIKLIINCRQTQEAHPVPVDCFCLATACSTRTTDFCMIDSCHGENYEVLVHTDTYVFKNLSSSRAQAPQLVSYLESLRQHYNWTGLKGLQNDVMRASLPSQSSIACKHCCMSSNACAVIAMLDNASNCWM